MNKILVSPSSFGECGDEPLNLLTEAGYEIIGNPYKRKLTEAEAIELAKDCVGIVAGVEPLTAAVMDALPALKVISRVGVGMDSVDLDYAAKKGIKVVNTPDGPTRGVAELTLAMTFAMLRKIPQADAAIKNGQWKKQTGNLIQGKVIGVLGLGRIGRMVAGFFRGIGNEVIGFDPYADKAWAEQAGVELGDFDAVLAKADIITLHVPGNADKTPVIGAEEFKKMKDKSFLVNIARGGVVDEAALYDALKSGKLSSAAIDVFVQEPYTGPLTELDNIILTPHLGSYATEGKLQMEIDAVKNIIGSLAE